MPLVSQRERGLKTFSGATVRENDQSSNGDTNVTTPMCALDIQPNGAVPVILMALGRSGSSVTWDTMARLTGDANVAHEITGSTEDETYRFFNSINSTEGSCWPIKQLQRVQEHTNSTSFSGIFGFQWKPYMKSYHHKYSLGALEIIAKHQDPPIRVIFLTRNVIDRIISNMRHEKSDVGELAPHCNAGDTKCVRKHKAHSKNITLPSGKKLQDLIMQRLGNDDVRKERLAVAGVKYLHVSYEKLFLTDTATEWMKIFQFLERGPTENLTMDMVRAVSTMASTNFKRHSAVISNYNEVKSSLSWGRYKYLLH